jgi:hypothetical protein
MLRLVFFFVKKAKKRFIDLHKRFVKVSEKK